MDISIACNNKSERALFYLMLIYLTSETVWAYPIAVFAQFMGVEYAVLSGVVMAVVYLVLAIRAMDRRTVAYVRTGDFLLILFFALYVLVSAMGDDHNRMAIEEVLATEMLPCIPVFFLALCFAADERSMDVLGRWCCFAVVLTSVYRLVYQNPDEVWDMEYNMGAAYTLVPNTLIAINYAFIKKKIIPIVCCLVGLFYSLSMGTRGPLIILLCFILICFYFHFKSRRWIKILILILIGAILLFSTTSYFVGLLADLQVLLGRLGFSTRILDFALEGEALSNTSGRDDIYAVLWERMTERPIFGWGVLGERQFGFLSAHNIYIQFLFDYGIVVGSILMVGLFVSVFYAYKSTSNVYARQWILIWATFVMVKGIFGGGVLRFEVFMLLGFCLREIRYNKFINN